MRAASATLRTRLNPKYKHKCPVPRNLKPRRNRKDGGRASRIRARRSSPKPQTLPHAMVQFRYFRFQPPTWMLYMKNELSTLHRTSLQLRRRVGAPSADGTAVFMTTESQLSFCSLKHCHYHKWFVSMVVARLPVKLLSWDNPLGIGVFADLDAPQPEAFVVLQFFCLEPAVFEIGL